MLSSVNEPARHPPQAGSNAAAAHRITKKQRQGGAAAAAAAAAATTIQRQTIYVHVRGQQGTPKKKECRRRDEPSHYLLRQQQLPMVRGEGTNSLAARTTAQQTQQSLPIIAVSN